jgi:hypothetical protein
MRELALAASNVRNMFNADREAGRPVAKAVIAALTRAVKGGVRGSSKRADPPRDIAEHETRKADRAHT